MKKQLLLYVILLIAPNCFTQNKTIDSLKLALKNAKHDTTRVSTLLILSDQLSISKPDTVISILKEVLLIIDKKIIKANETEKNTYLIFRATAYNNFGSRYSNEGKTILAMDYFNKSLKIFEEVNYQIGISSVLSEIGIIHYYQGDVPKALEYFIRSAKIKEEIGDKKGLAMAFINIGYVYNTIGNIQRAITYYDNGLKIFEGIGDKIGIATSLNNLGNIFQDQKDFDSALKYFRRSLKIFEETGDKGGVAMALANIGGIYRDQLDFSMALQCYNKSLKIFEEVGDKRKAATIIDNIGGCYQKQKQSNLQLALEYYFKGLNIRKEIGDKEGLTFSLNNIGAIYLKQEKYLIALAYSDSSLVLAKTLNLMVSMRNAEGIISQINEGSGNYDNAYKHYKQFIIYRDSLNNKETRKAGVKTQLKYEYEKKAAADSVKVAEEKKVVAVQLKQEKTQRFALYGGLVLVLVFAGFMFNRFRVTQKQKNIIELKEKETQQQNEIITIQKHLVEEKHKEITDSINYAERIQRSFLATEKQLNENLNNYFVLFKPKDVVSGDFYWSATLSNGNFALATSDSTGHGVPGAIMSLLNVTSLEKAIEHYTNPADILNHTRQTIIERLKKDGSEEGGKDGMDCSLLVFDYPNKLLHMAAANNPVWIIRSNSPFEGGVRRTGDVELIEIKPDKMPVGKSDKQDQSFTTHTIELQKGDTIYTLTDGFPDQFGGPNGKKFMSKKLKELLLANVHLPIIQQKELLDSTFKNWVGDLEQVDDVCIIGIKV